MSKNKKTESHEELVTFMPGSSVIDIGEIRRAQNEELSLDEEAELIREEIAADPEFKKDVLSDYTESESDSDLDKIASKIQIQEAATLKEYELLADEVSDELKDLNTLLIAEDQLLESTILNSDSDEEISVEEMSEEAAELKAALPQMDENGNFDLADLQSCIEALLFYSDKPVSLKKLKDMLEMSEAEDAPILEAIERLKAQFSGPETGKAHGFEVAEIAGGYQLRTKASKAPLLRKLAKIQIQRLSRGAMETLTIVSYKQPCTKDEIDSVRGVDSSHFIRTLLDRKLIEVSGRSEAAGRPMIYATTDTFLEVFGLMDLKGLPPLREIEAMVPQMVATEEGAEDPRVIQMRKLVSQMKAESNHLGYSAKEDDQILHDIRERVKSIDISTPYLERQKALAAEGLTPEQAELILSKEFKFDQATSGGEVIHEESLTLDTELAETERSLTEELNESTDNAN